MRTQLPLRLCAAFALLCCSATAFADNDKGLYVGAGVGTFNIKTGDIETIDDVTTIIEGFDSDDTAFKIFGGWRFNRYIAVDLAYIDFGNPDDEIVGLNVKAGIDGFAPSIVGTLPLGPIELFARAGYLFYDLDVEVAGQKIESASGSDEDFMYGAGLGLTLFGRLNARLEYDLIEVSDVVDDADAIWLSAEWRF